MSPGPIRARSPRVPASVSPAGLGVPSARSGSRPSARKSSQKFWMSSNQPLRSQCSENVTSRQVVATATVPAPGCVGSKPGRLMRRPRIPCSSVHWFTLPPNIACRRPRGRTVTPSYPTGFICVYASVTSTARREGFRRRQRKTATGRPDTRSSSGTNGVNASSSASTGRLESWNRMVAVGYVPTKVASSSRGSAEAAQGDRPRSPTKGGRRRRSRIRATASPPSGRAQIEKKQRGRSHPLAGRLKISQSRSWPRPPSEIVPVPMPPRGNAISLSAAPVKWRARAAAPDGATVPGAMVVGGVVAVDMLVS